MSKVARNSFTDTEDANSEDPVNGAEQTYKLRYRTDVLNVKGDICVALRVDTAAIIKKWKGKSTQKLMDHLLIFVGGLAFTDKEEGSSHDVFLSVYCLVQSGEVQPTYAEFKRFWLGKPLNDFYLILRASKKHPGIGDLFTYYMEQQGLPIVERLEIPAIPQYTMPVFRLRNNQVCIYVEPTEIDPARGNQPCSVFFTFHKGWPGYAYYPLDPDTCLSQDLAAGKTVLHPGLVMLESSDSSSLRVEMKYYKWKKEDKKPRKAKS